MVTCDDSSCPVCLAKCAANSFADLSEGMASLVIGEGVADEEVVGKHFFKIPVLYFFSKVGMFVRFHHYTFRVQEFMVLVMVSRMFVRVFSRSLRTSQLCFLDYIPHLH